MTPSTGGFAGLGGWAAAWLLTYWMHSTLLLGSAWILGRWVLRRDAWRDVIGKAALVGALFTTSVSFTTLRPWGLELSVPIVGSMEAGAGTENTAPTVLTPLAEDGASTPEIDELRSAFRSPSPSSSPSGSSAPEPIDPATPATRSSEAATPPSRAATLAERTPALLLAAWLAGATLLLGALLRRHRRLHHLLRDRRAVSDGPLAGMLAGLRRSTGVWHPVRLSATASVATPLALGRAEICVPLRFLDHLGEEEQKAALAHELGHLVRRDPAWNLLAQVLEAVFFFQPLHRVARARLRESAEFLADAWAVRETGCRLGLARCLAEVANWVSPVEAPELAGSVAMAEGGSPLLARVRRLLENEPESASPPAASRVAAWGLVAVTAGFAPAVSTHASALPPSSDPSDPVEAQSSPGEIGYAQQVVEVVRVPANGPLAERIRTGASMAESAGARAYWLAWVFEGAVQPREQVSDDTGPFGGWQNLPAVEGVLRVASEVGPAGSGDLIVLVQQAPQAGGARIVRLAMRSPGLGIDLQGRPVYWLGRAAPEQSLAWSSDLFRSPGQPLDVRNAAIEIVSRHALPEARQMLVEVATSRSETPELRSEAVEGLANYPADQTVELLSRLAVEDANTTVKHEAAETLGEVDNPRAGPALETLLRGPAATDVKEEALEALAERADTLLAQVLLEIALRDPDPTLRIAAVEEMEELPPEEALPVLRRVLAESSDRGVRVEAVETIGEIGSDEALAALDGMIAERDGEVAEAAVEAIAEFSSPTVGPLLARIAREHPLAEVRSEALDQLSELGASELTRDLLLDLALTGTSADVRLEAVEQMEELPSDDAVALLGRVVFDSQDSDAQRQAAESLGEIGSDEALELLDRVVREHANESVARQAVESIGEYPEDRAGPLLRRIATEHRFRSVRREALSQLGGDPTS